MQNTYSQQAKALSMLLLTSILLQSCGTNLMLEEHRSQMREKRQEALATSQPNSFQAETKPEHRERLHAASSQAPPPYTAPSAWKAHQQRARKARGLPLTNPEAGLPGGMMHEGADEEKQSGPPPAERKVELEDEEDGEKEAGELQEYKDELKQVSAEGQTRTVARQGSFGGRGFEEVKRGQEQLMGELQEILRVAELMEEPVRPGPATGNTMILRMATSGNPKDVEAARSFLQGGIENEDTAVRYEAREVLVELASQHSDLVRKILEQATRNTNPIIRSTVVGTLAAITHRYPDQVVVQDMLQASMENSGVEGSTPASVILILLACQNSSIVQEVLYRLMLQNTQRQVRNNVVKIFLVLYKQAEDLVLTMLQEAIESSEQRLGNAAKDILIALAPQNLDLVRKVLRKAIGAEDATSHSCSLVIATCVELIPDHPDLAQSIFQVAMNSPSHLARETASKALLTAISQYPDLVSKVLVEAMRDSNAACTRDAAKDIIMRLAANNFNSVEPILRLAAEQWHANLTFEDIARSLLENPHLQERTKEFLKGLLTDTNIAIRRAGGELLKKLYDFFEGLCGLPRWLSRRIDIKAIILDILGETMKNQHEDTRNTAVETLANIAREGESQHLEGVATFLETTLQRGESTIQAEAASDAILKISSDLSERSTNVQVPVEDRHRATQNLIRIRRGLERVSSSSRRDVVRRTLQNVSALPALTQEDLGKLMNALPRRLR